jgi:hypothetical protein
MSTTSALRASTALKLFFTSLCACAVVHGALLGGCAEQPNTIPMSSSAGPAGPGSSTGSGQSDSGPSSEGEELFHDLEADLFTVCGACHDAGGLADTPFLAGPDRYQSMVSWPGLVKKNPAESLLLTYSIIGGGHSGVNLNGMGVDPTLKPRVELWLAEEANAIAEPPPEVGPAIEPFSPIMGFNAVYLGQLGADFEGMAVTFNAEEVTSKTLELRNIEVHTTSKLGVHLVHPLFVVFPNSVDADPDPVDSFSNVDDTFVAGTSGTLGPGTVLLTNWAEKAKLTIAFEKIEKVDTAMADAGDAGMGGCLDVESFKTNAEPQLSARCLGCHGGSNGQATGAVDMTQLGKDSAKACEQIRFRVNPLNPGASQIFVTTDPGGNAAHPYKFNQNQGNFNTFKDAVSIWIAAEKQ